MLIDCSENYWLESKNGNAKEPEEHEYHWRLIRFLSSCAEGGNRNCLQTLQQIFSLEELYEVILNPRIHVDLKRPYLRYLLWVYLDSNPQASDSHVADIQLNPNFWSVLDLIADTLNEIAAKDFSKPLEKHDSFFAFEAGATVPRKFFTHFFHITKALVEKVTHLKEHVDKISKAFLNFLTKMMDHSDWFSYHHKTLFSSALVAMRDAVNKDVDVELKKPEFHIIEKFGEVNLLISRIFEDDDKLTSTTKNDDDKLTSTTKNDKQTATFKNKDAHDYEKTHEQDLAVNTLLDKAVDCLRKTYEEETSTKDMVKAKIPGGEEFNNFICTILKKETQRAAPYRLYKLNVQRVRDIVNKMNKSFEYSGKEDKAATKSYMETDEALLKLLAAVIRIPRFSGAKNKRTHVSKAKHRIQDHLCSVGVAPVAVNFISTKYARGDSVNSASLSLLRELLSEGNETSQLAMLAYFQSTSEESFFEDIRRRLTQRLDVFKELRTMKNQLIEDENRTRSSKQKPLTVAGDKPEKPNPGFLDRLNSFIEYEINLKVDTKVDPSITSRATDGGSNENKISNLKSDTMNGRGSSPKPNSSSKQDEVSKTNKKPNQNMKRTHIEESFKLANQEAESIMLLLQVMQSLAKGRNKELKAYLRAQEDNVGRSVDLVKEVAAYLHDLYPSISLPTLPLVTELVATLRILCSGNSENQQIAFDNKVVEICNTVFRQKKPYPHCFFTEFLDLKVQMAGLLFTMVEHNDEKTKKDLAPQVHAVVTIPLLFANMKFYAEHPQTLTLLHQPQFIDTKKHTFKYYSENSQVFNDCKVTTLDAGVVFYSILARFNDLGLSAPVVEDDLVADISRGALAFDTSRKARKELKERKKNNVRLRISLPVS